MHNTSLKIAVMVATNIISHKANVGMHHACAYSYCNNSCIVATYTVIVYDNIVT